MAGVSDERGVAILELCEEIVRDVPEACVEFHVRELGLVTVACDHGEYVRELCRWAYEGTTGLSLKIAFHEAA